MSDGKAKCWGLNVYGRLGNGSTTTSLSPVTVSTPYSFKAIFMGREHGCAIEKLAASVLCWGHNQLGQLGDGSTSDRSAPVLVKGLGLVLDVAVGYSHTCAAIATGVVTCWGYNQHGQLGDGTKTNRTSPVAVAGMTGVKAVAAGYGFTCGLKTDGTVSCWGENSAGQLGDGTTTASLTPKTVSGLTSVVAIDAAGDAMCAVRSDGSVWCWGGNSYGKLGDGTTTSRSKPVKAATVTGAVAVQIDQESACARTSSKGVVCWGKYGGLKGTSSVTDIAQGAWHMCAVKTDGSVQCWGSNADGQLGDGTTQAQGGFVTVKNL